MTTSKLELTQSKIDSPPNWTALILLSVALIALSLAAILSKISERLSFLNLLAFAVILEGIYLAKTGKGADKA